MYLRIIDGQPKPYAVGYLKIENPNTSFPAQMSDEFLAEWDVYRYVIDDQPEHDPLIEQAWKGAFYQDADGQWHQGWDVKPKPESTAKRDVRLERDRLLAETDWRDVKAYERNENLEAKWESYRQALRDLTAQEGFPYSVEWPTKPE